MNDVNDANNDANLNSSLFTNNHPKFVLKIEEHIT